MRFREFIDSWTLIPIKKLLRFQNGINADSTKYGKGIKYISVSDILNNQYITYDCIKGLIDIDEKTLNRFIVEYGDILFQRSSETFEDIGRANVYLDKEHSATFGGFVIRGKKISDYNPLFFRYLLCTHNARKQTVRMGAGAQHYNIGQEGLEKICLYFPCLQEQQKISDLLFAIDNKIAVQNKIISKYETLIKGLYTKLQSKSAKKEYRICDIVKCHSVGLLSKENLTESGSKKCILYGELFTTYDEVINEIKSRTNVDGYISQGNEILFPSSTTVDAMSLIAPSALNEKGILLGGDMFVLELLPGFNNEYISYYLNTIAKRNLAKYAQGTTITHLYFEHIKNVLLYLPDITIQLSVASKMRKLKTKIQIEKEMLSALQKQKAFLLQSMFI